MGFLMAQRLEKVSKLQEAEMEPFAYSYGPTHTATQLQDEFASLEPGEEDEAADVAVSGRILARRVFGKLAFFTLQDSSGTIQLYLDKKRLGTFKAFIPLTDGGDIIGARGTMKRTEKGELSVVARECTMLTKALRPLPDKWSGFTDVNKRYRQRYLDMVSNPSVRRTFEARAKITSYIRRTLDARGFLEIETPALHSQAGGADAKPFETYPAQGTFGQSIRPAHLGRRSTVPVSIMTCTLRGLLALQLFSCCASLHVSSWAPISHRAARISHVTALAGNSDVEPNVSVDAAAAEIEAVMSKWPEPVSELEAQQRQVISILIERIGLQEDCEKAERTYQAVQATGDPAYCLEMQKERDRLDAQVAEWSKRFIWANEFAKARESLIERVATAEAETLAAEAQVEPLRAECKALESRESKARGEKTRLEGAKMACERALVTLPTDIAKLREAAAQLEAALSDVQTAIAPLEEEQVAVGERVAQLERDVGAAEAKLASTHGSLVEAKRRVDDLDAQLSEARAGVADGEEELRELASRETEMAAAYAPMLDALAAVQANAAAARESMRKLEERNQTLQAELTGASTELAEARDEFEKLREKLKVSRLRLVEVRKNQNRVAADEAAAVRECTTNEEMAREMMAEMERIRIEAPTLTARKARSKEEVEEALEALERFEKSDLATSLTQLPAADAADDGVGGAVDARISLTSRRLEAANVDVSKRLELLDGFNSKVQGVMDSATARRVDAQRTLEELAADQRRASEEIKTTMQASLEAMAAMQAQWDEAVLTNSAELREFKTSATGAVDRQQQVTRAMRASQQELASQNAALAALADERKSLAAEEETLRRRYAQLRQRRLQKQMGAAASQALDLDAAGELAEKAAAEAEKAAAGLFNTFGTMLSGKRSAGQLPPSKEKK